MHKRTKLEQTSSKIWFLFREIYDDKLKKYRFFCVVFISFHFVRQSEKWTNFVLIATKDQISRSSPPSMMMTTIELTVWIVDGSQNWLELAITMSKSVRWDQKCFYDGWKFNIWSAQFVILSISLSTSSISPFYYPFHFHCRPFFDEKKRSFHKSDNKKKFRQFITRQNRINQYKNQINTFHTYSSFNCTIFSY